MSTYSALVTFLAIGSIGSCMSALKQCNDTDKELTKYQASLQNISATRYGTNNVGYLSIPFNGKEIKLFQYNGTYQTPQKITEQEMQKAQRPVESNLVERIRGGK